MSRALAAVLICFAFTICFVMGWVFAHTTVALECRRLGSFYVGNTTFDCKARP